MATHARTRRILVVEDEPVINELCLKVLSREFAVDIAQDGGVAAQMLSRFQYDVIIADIRIPVADSKQLYNTVAREKPELLRRFIFTSGDSVSRNTSQFIEKSGQPFLAKPFTPGELLEKVKQTLSQSPEN